MTAEDSISSTEPEGQGDLSSASMEALAPVLLTPARSMEELRQAYRLVYHSYLDRGYIEANEMGERFGFHNLLPETTTFVGMLKTTVIATVTLVVDTSMGLPMEEIYHDELEPLRREGQRLGEVTMLADRRQQFRRTLPMVLALFRVLMDHAIEVAKIDQLCITLNPRHADFYRELLHFHPLGGEKSYPSVRDNPALAMRFPLETLGGLLKQDARYRGLYERTETIRRAGEESRYRLTSKAARELAGRLAETGGLTEGQREYLRQQYGPTVLK